ncbi:hypothetical protein [Achromobacter sp. DH1f]|nr:hypothetical protein [Achromobacter sp. DH1f]
MLAPLNAVLMVSVFIGMAAVTLDEYFDAIDSPDLEGLGLLPRDAAA